MPLGKVDCGIECVNFKKTALLVSKRVGCGYIPGVVMPHIPLPIVVGYNDIHNKSIYAKAIDHKSTFLKCGATEEC